ncbi:BRE1-domain-containing protein [Trametes sanguinea]|nr:BRE1-domain-containing protein [Trametes sanguinea]
MESRKRPHGDDGESSRPKKRAVSDDRASPSHPNGTTSHSDEPKETDNVELFRKEAIYRRMKHYSREAERSQARVAELERRRTQCEAGLAALEACWTQIIGTIRSLVKPEDLPSLQKDSEGEFISIRELTLHVSSEAEPEYVDALRDKMQATTDIVKAFVNLSTQGRAGPSDEEMARRCQEAEAEVRKSQKEQYREALVAAEKRADRLQSKSLNPEAAKLQEEPREGSSSEQVDASSPKPPPLSAADAQDLADWQMLAEARETRIEGLMRENAELRDQLNATRIQLLSLPADVVSESTYYKIILDKASRMEYVAQEARVENSRLKDTLDEMRTAHQQEHDAYRTSSESAIQELKAMISKRDNDILRLRDQRDQYHAELHERRAKDSVKMNSLTELKALAEARAERIAVLESETRRLKTRLASNSGDEDLVAFLWSDNADSMSYVDDLKRRASEAEARVATLEKALTSLDGERADLAKVSQSEAELRHRVEQLQKELDKYQAVYGNGSSLPPETAQLSEQLQRQQAEIEKLHVQEKQREQAESALYSELDKLSAAWEALDRQLKSKVYDLTAIEERMSKTNIEVCIGRAKAENKFFAAMRDKESSDQERKNLTRNLDKAGKALDKLAESEKALMTRIHLLEKEAANLKRVADAQKEQTNYLQSDSNEWRTRFFGERKTVEEKRTELRKLEESLIKAKSSVEKQAAKLKSLSSSSGSNAREAELQSEIDKCMMNMRNTVITKCMHTFCKQCVEARIATRQRKCPACNLPFSQGEVQQLYFQ